ncbi:hypothetical protein EV702DRAFT_1048698 [Suillus placidus]|uniref:Uncharacterized protein n=1 Tax=Suillus placidus TaxID=48579 RepID=A0A9P6ZNB3_9AGAM|nr:hypothetical protein EV702DRAFT_1048698 [Suillus placidus]
MNARRPPAIAEHLTRKERKKNVTWLFVGTHRTLEITRICQLEAERTPSFLDLLCLFARLLITSTPPMIDLHALELHIAYTNDIGHHGELPCLLERTPQRSPTLREHDFLRHERASMRLQCPTSQARTLWWLASEWSASFLASPEMDQGIFSWMQERSIFMSRIHGDHHIGLAKILAMRQRLDPPPEELLYLISNRMVFLYLRDYNTLEELGFSDMHGPVRYLP